MKKWYSISLNILSFCFLFMAGLHIAFWKIFDWEHTLSCLSEGNRNAMYTLDLMVIILFIAIAFITIFLKKELLTTILGKYILIWFSFFGISRVIIELTIWNPPDLTVLILGSAAGIIYALPLITKKLVLTGK
jgi:hypothetical protein